MLSHFSRTSAAIALRTMTDGLPHPKAQQHIIKYDMNATLASSEWCDELHINESRLGVVFRPGDSEDNRFSVVVWNWTTGEIVLVRGPYYDMLVPIDAAYPSPPSSSASRTSVARPFSSWMNTGSLFGKMTTTSLTSTILHASPRPGGRWTTERSAWVYPTGFTSM